MVFALQVASKSITACEKDISKLDTYFIQPLCLYTTKMLIAIVSSIIVNLNNELQETAKGELIWTDCEALTFYLEILEPSRSRSQTKVPMETTHEGLSTSDV